MVKKKIEELTIEDIKPLTISFKKNEDELELYKWILRHSNQSGFIKDLLREKMNGNDSIEIHAKNNKIEQPKDLLKFDF